MKLISAAGLTDVCKERLFALEFVILTVAVMFNHVIDVFVAAAAAVDQDRAGAHLLRKLHRVGDRVRRFESRDDAFVAGELEEGVNRLLVARGDVVDASEILPERMLRTDGRIIESAGDRVDRIGGAVLVFQDIAVESVHGAFPAVAEGRGMVALPGTASEGFDSVDVHGIAEEGGEHAGGVAAAADAGADGVGQDSGHLLELLAGFDSDAHLEVADHQRERVRPKRGADAVNGVFVGGEIGFKRGIDRLFQRLESAGDGDDLCAEDFHAGDVRRLFPDVDEPHVDFALKPEICGGGGEGDSVLTRAGFRDEFFLAEIFREQTFAHAMVELVGAGVVEILALEIDLAVADVAGEAVAVIDGSGAPLELAADAAEFVDEFRGMADRLISVRNFAEGSLEFGRNAAAAEFAETAVFVGIVSEIA